MLNILPFSSPNNFRRAGIIGLVCLLAVTASACGGVISNPTTPTSTTVMGGIQPTEPLSATTTLEKANAANKTDVCGLATKPEVETVLGQAVIAITPGSEPDSVSGGTLNFCSYQGNDLVVLLSLVDLGSPDAAVKTLGSELDKMKSDTPSATVAQEGGIGDQVYWATTEHGCSFTVRKGSTVFSVALGGNIGDPSTHKAELRTLTETVAGRV